MIGRHTRTVVPRPLPGLVAFARIAHDDLGLRTGGRQADLDAAAARRELHRVRHQIPDNLMQPRIEQLVDPLSCELRNGLSNRFADELAAADDGAIRGVGQLVDVIGPAENGRRDRRLREQGRAPRPEQLRAPEPRPVGAGRTGAPVRGTGTPDRAGRRTQRLD
jgi:hypothetical protein